MSEAAGGTYGPTWNVPALTPERVRSVRFSRTPIGRRGLSEDEVWRFVEHMAAEIARRDAVEAALIATSEKYRNALRTWQQEQVDRRDSVAQERSKKRRPDVELVNMMSRAQQEADALIAQTQAYCRQLAADAQEQADALLDNARLRAEDAAERAVHTYRASAGGEYSAATEELERRLAWVRTFIASLGSVESQLSTARQALEMEVERVVDIAQPRERV
ncbi:MAG TPA: hypothetical protein VE575_14170 [Acidimicrobiales bacterium]|jgi:cell division initiation protein|nr:hypothetical protein [Acidimicrobiales bacterium]